VLLLTRDSAYSVRTFVTVAPLTRSVRAIASHVPVGPDDGIRRESAINLDDLQTIPVAQLDRRVTRLSAEKMAEVESAIKFALALP
jgi:mRNA interferase MazF